MPSLQALVASADNYLDNQNSEGALATGKSFFCQAYKKRMQNDAKRMQQSQLCPKDS